MGKAHSQDSRMDIDGSEAQRSHVSTHLERQGLDAALRVLARVGVVAYDLGCNGGDPSAGVRLAGHAARGKQGGSRVVKSVPALFERIRGMDEREAVTHWKLLIPMLSSLSTLASTSLIVARPPSCAEAGLKISFACVPQSVKNAAASLAAAGAEYTLVGGSPSRLVLAQLAYEKPVPVGWSKNTIVALFVQLQGFHSVSILSA